MAPRASEPHAVLILFIYLPMRGVKRCPALSKEEEYIGSPHFVASTSSQLLRESFDIPSIVHCLRGFLCAYHAPKFLFISTTW